MNSQDFVLSEKKGAYMPTIDQQEDFQVGTRIKFLQELTEPACGDHPTLLYCNKDEQGEITHVGKDKDGNTTYAAKTDSWSSSFTVLRSEFSSI